LSRPLLLNLIYAKGPHRETPSTSIIADHYSIRPGAHRLYSGRYSRSDRHLSSTDRYAYRAAHANGHVHTVTHFHANGHDHQSTAHEDPHDQTNGHASRNRDSNEGAQTDEHQRP